MATWIVLVGHDEYTYSYSPLAERTPFPTWEQGLPGARIKVIEQLEGWEGWEYAISVEAGWESGIYFIGRTGPDEPWPGLLQEAIDAYGGEESPSLVASTAQLTISTVAPEAAAPPSRETTSYHSRGGLPRHKWSILFLILFVPTSLYMLGNGTGSLSWQQIEAEVITNAIILALVVGALRLLVWALTKLWRAVRGSRPTREPKQPKGANTTPKARDVG